MNRANNEQFVGLYGRTLAALGGQPIPAIAILMERVGLTAGEAGQLVWEQMTWWHYRSHTIAHVSELTDGERAEFDRSVRDSYGKGALQRLWYDTTKPTLNPDAVRYVDDLLARPG
jgi:hypothetical protein